MDRFVLVQFNGMYIWSQPVKISGISDMQSLKQALLEAINTYYSHRSTQSDLSKVEIEGVIVCWACPGESGDKNLILTHGCEYLLLDSLSFVEQRGWKDYLYVNYRF